MAMKLVVEFMGLMAIVPQGSGKRADVLAVRDRDHAAWLTIDADDVEEGGLAKATAVLALPDGRRVAIWPLADQIVTFRPEGAAVTDELQLRHDPAGLKNKTPCFPEAEWLGFCWRDLRWIGNVTKASGGRKLREGLLGAPSQYVEAIVRLDSGRLGAIRPHVDALRWTVWRFQETDTDREEPCSDAAEANCSHERALSDHAAVEMESARSITIQLQPAGISITVKPRVTNGVSRVAIASLPKKGAASEELKPIEHFSAFYTLLEPGSGKKRIPYPHKLPQRRSLDTSGALDPRGLSSSDCPPGLIQP